MKKEDYDRHGIDWVYKAFVFSDVAIYDFDLFKLIKDKQITNPKQVAEFLLKKHNIEDVGPGIYYKKVLRNQEVNSLGRLEIVNRVLGVSDNPARDILNCTFLLYRYKYNTKFKELVETAYLFEKINVAWSDKRIEEEMEYRTHRGDISYEGYIEMLPNCKLITNYKTLKKQAILYKNCLVSYWEKIKSKQCFLITMTSPIEMIFEISLHKCLLEFTVSEMRERRKVRASITTLTEITRWIRTPNAQIFFAQNYHGYEGYSYKGFESSNYVVYHGFDCPKFEPRIIKQGIINSLKPPKLLVNQD